MFIISEYVACVLAVWVGMTLLFMAGVMFLALEAGCTIAERKLYDLTRMGVPRLGRWLAVGVREP